MGFTAITTVAITLFIVGFFAIIVYDVQGIISSIKSDVELAVYLEDNISEELKVDLPEPLGPTKKRNSPFLITRLIFFNATVLSSYILLIFFNSIIFISNCFLYPL
ncbi:unnamed protein product [marine sediment metagenome]|uniref:Uncharacterized protein n=1 Tax=marine sediment metagenome TaxID=412755 RepID=X1AY32_9ZZZZ